jgi:hypothetical protein
LPDDFQTKNSNLRKLLRALEWKWLVYSLAIWNMLRQFGTFFGYIFGNLVAIWYISPVLINCVKKNLATLVLSENLDQWFLRVSSS